MALKGILKAIQSHIIVEDEQPQGAEAPADAPKTSGTTTSMLGQTGPVAVVLPKAVATVRPLMVDQEIVDRIVANIAGKTSPAYKSFQEKMGLLTMLPEGSVRVQAACATAGVKPADVVAELDRRINAADQELAAVESTATSEREKRVGQIEAEVGQIDARIQQKNEEIARLEETVRLLREGIKEQEDQRAELVGQIPAEDAKIAAGLDKFRRAHGHVKAMLMAEKSTLTGMLAGS